MSDGYQVGVLSLVNVCFSKIYGDAYTSEMSTRLGNALFCGIVLGQVGHNFYFQGYESKTWDAKTFSCLFVDRLIGRIARIRILH